LAINKIEKSHDLEFIKGYYSYGYLNISPDIIIFRHILEHQKNPYLFFNKIIPKIKADNKVSIYIEVPAWEWIIDTNCVYTFSYEHCSYYSKYSIEYALESLNFYSKKISFSFDNEYIQYYGVNFNSTEKLKHSELISRESIIEKSELFIRNYILSIEKLKKGLREILDNAILWGAAGKGTTLLNLLDINHNQLKYVVDSNPSRRNTFIPRTAQQVVSPEFLKELKPKYILITNHSYYNEIKSQISRLDLNSDILSIDKLLKDERFL